MKKSKKIAVAHPTIGKIDKTFLKSSVEWLRANKCGCCFQKVAETAGGLTGLFIVIGWSCGYDECENNPNADGTYRIEAKIAYQHSNNIMQADYDVDWVQPYDLVLGEVDDTSTEIGDDYDDEVKYLNDEAAKSWERWKDQLDLMK